MNSGIYQIVNTVNQKRYIGFSKNIYKRYEQHLNDLIKEIHHNNHLQAAWDKYGKAVFILEPLQFCKRNKLSILEDYWCKILKVHDSEYGYNIQPTDPNGRYKLAEETKIKISKANSGRKMSDEVKNAMSERAKKQDFSNRKYSEKSRQILIARNKSRAGIVTPDNVKRKIADGNRGKKQPPEAIKKTADANRGKPARNPNTRTQNIGVKRTEEFKQNLSKFWKEKWENKIGYNNKTVIRTDSKTGEQIQYKSVTEAALNNNVSWSSIKNYVTGISKASPYKWEYKKAKE